MLPSNLPAAAMLFNRRPSKYDKRPKMTVPVSPRWGRFLFWHRLRGQLWAAGPVLAKPLAPKRANVRILLKIARWPQRNSTSPHVTGTEHPCIWSKRMTQVRNWNHECPSCSAKLLFVRVKSLFSESEGAYCSWCGGALQARDGEYLLQYTLVDRPRDDRKTQAKSRPVAAAGRVTEQWL